jgi:imidazole glycerol-phosphate synthase subunit HisF
MLKKRVIPLVLIDGFSVLKTINFDVRRNLGSPVTVMRTYNTRNVDEMIILDIDATRQGRSIDKFVIEEIAKDCFMPLTVGGGISHCEDIEDLLKKGADKISINSVALDCPSKVQEFSREFGSQCIVVSIDLVERGGDYYIYSDKNVREDINLYDYLAEVEDLGAGEILINNVSRDGCMSGGDSNLAKLLNDKIHVPLIYCGGISSPEDSLEVMKASNADALGISSIFHFTNYTPDDCRRALRENGIPAR